MDSLVQVHLHFSKELQCFRGGHGFFTSSSYSFACVYPARCICYASWILAESALFSYTYAKCEVTRRPWDRQIGVKSASSPPRAKSAPRGSKSTTFSKGICQPFELRNSFLIHIKTDFEIYGSSIGVCNYVRQTIPFPNLLIKLCLVISYTKTYLKGFLGSTQSPQWFGLSAAIRCRLIRRD